MAARKTPKQTQSRSTSGSRGATAGAVILFAGQRGSVQGQVVSKKGSTLTVKDWNGKTRTVPAAKVQRVVQTAASVKAEQARAKRSLASRAGGGSSSSSRSSSKRGGGSSGRGRGGGGGGWNESKHSRDSRGRFK